jgi:hypothetical protein
MYFVLKGIGMNHMGHLLLHFNENFAVLKAELNINVLWKNTFLQGQTLRLREVGNYVIYNLFIFDICFKIKKHRDAAQHHNGSSRALDMLMKRVRLIAVTVQNSVSIRNFERNVSSILRTCARP